MVALPPLRSLHLILMSRAPVAGETKTRLVPSLGAEGARDFHVACLNDLLDEARAWLRTRRKRGLPPAAAHLFITPPASQPAFRSAGVRWPNDFSLHNQRGETLGERMAHAMERVRRGSDEPCGAVLVGADLPLLTGDHLDAAVDALADADMVFGPTPDGGYYLVALRGVPGTLFDSPRWGGPGVLEDALARCKADGKTAILIDPLPDVDTPEDIPAVLEHPLAARLAGRKSLGLLRDWREWRSLH